MTFQIDMAELPDDQLPPDAEDAEPVPPIPTDIKNDVVNEPVPDALPNEEDV